MEGCNILDEELQNRLESCNLELEEILRL